MLEDNERNTEQTQSKTKTENRMFKRALTQIKDTKLANKNLQKYEKKRKRGKKGGSFDADSEKTEQWVNTQETQMEEETLEQKGLKKGGQISMNQSPVDFNTEKSLKTFVSTLKRKFDNMAY